MKTVKLTVLALAVLLASSLAQPSVLPDFKLSDASGKAVQPESLKGRPSLIVFWATWCGICTSELPQLRQLALQDKVPVFMLSVSDTKEDVLNFFNGFKLTGLQPLFARDGGDTPEAVGNRWKVRGQPEIFVLDAQANLIQHHVGYTDVEEIRQELK